MRKSSACVFFGEKKQKQNKNPCLDHFNYCLQIKKNAGGNNFSCLNENHSICFILFWNFVHKYCTVYCRIT